jgi:hypothetical protein
MKRDQVILIQKIQPRGGLTSVKFSKYGQDDHYVESCVSVTDAEIQAMRDNPEYRVHYEFGAIWGFGPAIK